MTNNQAAYWGYSEDLSADWASYGAGPYWAYNSVWNKGSLVDGTDYTQSITLYPGTFPNSTAMTWSWPNTPASNNVYSYPGVFYGTYGNVAPQTAPTPKQVSALNTLALAHNLFLSGNTDEFDVIYDMYTSTTAGGTTYDHEIEIIVHTPSYYQEYVNDLYGDKTYTDANGMTWTVGVVPGASPPQILFMPSSGQDILDTTIDAKAMFNWAVSRGLMSSSEYFDGIGLGAEPKENSGTLQVNSFNVTFN